MSLLRVIDSEHDLALDVPGRGALVGRRRLVERERAIHGDAYGAITEQTAKLGELSAIRAHLRRGYRDAKVSSLVVTGESQREDGKQRTAAPDRLQKAVRCGATDSIDNQVHATHDLLRRGFCVIDELVCAEIVQESLVTARRTGASPQGLCARQRFGRHNANIG